MSRRTNTKRDEALEVSCASCGARPGTPCSTRAPVGSHIVRRDLAEQYRRVRQHERPTTGSAPRTATNTRARD